MQAGHMMENITHHSLNFARLPVYYVTFFHGHLKFMPKHFNSRALSPPAFRAAIAQRSAIVSQMTPSEIP
jgi:hypothetical protein